MHEVITLPIRIDMSVGETECEQDQECVTCIPTYTGKKCACPADYILQDDNSCLTEATIDGQIQRLAPPSELRGKETFHSRLQARIRG